MQPRKPRAELWTLSLVLHQLRGAEGFPPPPHSLTPRSRRADSGFLLCTLPESPGFPLALHSWEAGGGQEGEWNRLRKSNDPIKN